ncbi:site-specific DNA-methyltransferase [Bacillus cereus]|uniref:DNA-methyltransferase n=1 Tax=Bacillus cereus TaxID=1396 RepID=UPI0024050BE1|nr:site-specific DNA-methyltransferase [Bacillus cereus]MCU5039323.1 site-specific DNA-methyltransferase [Bacillus cereus]MDA2655869.1 site-specific DNA-methyltransferase [Bacillus cereus]MDF9523190.1 site-specific DNA-methyltransferase [Bacillus cereus]MDF9561886.1 site-specific DNA-methyltransferase [Bacillus cereus]
MLNKIHNMDCLEGMKLIEDKSIDMILCDLPYGTTNCSWDSIIPFELIWDQFKRIIKDNGAIVLTASQPFTSHLIMSNPKMFKYTWVWEKSKATGFLNAKKRPLVAHEDICVFYKKQPTYNPQFTQGDPYNKGTRKQQTTDDVYNSFQRVEVKSEGKRYPRSVQYFKTAESEGKTIHKSQKPVALFEYLIKTYTNEGETVLDTCMGSGTTAIAAINTNRNFIGFEILEEYCTAANERINNMQRVLQVI